MQESERRSIADARRRSPVLACPHHFLSARSLQCKRRRFMLPDSTEQEMSSHFFECRQHRRPVLEIPVC